MLNIEKYKDFVLENLKFCRLKAGLLKEDVKIIPCKDVSCTECKERCLKWLMEEYKEPVLDDVEKKYLSEVIKPFKKHVVGITKCICEDESLCYIDISLTKDGSFWDTELLPFKKDLNMYKKMEPWREYSIKELGL